MKQECTAQTVGSCKIVTRGSDLHIRPFSMGENHNKGYTLHNIFPQTTMDDSMPKNEKEWKEKLTPEQYHILRQKGTEPPFSGEYYHNEEDGMYHCAACGAALFSSSAKYDSGSGWPSFFQANAPESIKLDTDDSHGMHRTEVVCTRCGGHLGHLFDDGPQPTGQRYCINSAALKFKEK